MYCYWTTEEWLSSMGAKTRCRKYGSESFYFSYSEGNIHQRQKTKYCGALQSETSLLREQRARTVSLYYKEWFYWENGSRQRRCSALSVTATYITEDSIWQDLFFFFMGMNEAWKLHSQHEYYITRHDNRLHDVTSRISNEQWVRLLALKGNKTSSSDMEEEEQENLWYSQNGYLKMFQSEHFTFGLFFLVS